jgi:hypothetical protein
LARPIASAAVCGSQGANGGEGRYSPDVPRSPLPPPGLPDRETLLAYLREHGEAGKADLARAFGLKGADRRALRHMLNDLEASGALGRRGRRGFAEAGSLPPVGVVDVVERDPDGDLYVRLTKGGEDAPAVPTRARQGGEERRRAGPRRSAAGPLRTARERRA